MRVVVAGLGVQGHKRRRIAGADFVAAVDPVNEEARYRTIMDVPLADYDAVLACIPDEPKIDVLTYLIGEASTWPRRGSHGQNQVVDLARQEVCWTKYGNVRRFECWRWDNSFIYHAVDHALVIQLAGMKPEAVDQSSGVDLRNRVHAVGERGHVRDVQSVAVDAAG